MKAKSIKGNSTEEIQSALQQSMADGFKPTAFVFLSFKQDRSGICKILDDEGIAFFGATTNVVQAGCIRANGRIFLECTTGKGHRWKFRDA